MPDGSYSVSDIQKYFEYILKKHGKKTGKRTEEKADNSSIKIFVNKIDNTTLFQIKTAYYLELLTPWNKEFTWKY